MENKVCNDCFYMKINYNNSPGFYCKHQDKDLGEFGLTNKACEDFKVKVYTDIDVSRTGWETEIKNVLTNEQYGVKDCVDLLNEYYYEIQRLKCQLKRRTRQRDELADFNVELMEKNKELQKQAILFKTRRKDVEDLIIKNSELIKENTNLQVELVSQSEEVEILSEKNKELKAKVDDKEVAVEVECEKLMQRVFDLIDEKANISHKYMEEWAFKDVPAATTKEYYYSGMLDACRQLQNELKEELHK